MAKKLFEIPVEKIVFDKEHQVRVKDSLEVIEAYAEAIAEAKNQWPFPTDEKNGIQAWTNDNGETYWLSDGIHRARAAKRVGLKMIPVIPHEGSSEDVIIAALPANAEHGLHRTRDDKKNAVRLALNTTKLRKLSDNALADIIKVSPTTIGTYREQLEKEGAIPLTTKRTNKAGKEIDATKAGRPKKETEQDVDDSGEMENQEHGEDWIWTDKRGREIPEDMVSYFSDDLPNIDNARKAIRNARNSMKNIFALDENERPEFTGIINAKRDYLKGLREAEKAIADTADNICPYCKATDSDCPGCEGKGVVTDEVYNAAPKKFTESDLIADAAYWAKQFQKASNKKTTVEEAEPTKEEKPKKKVIRSSKKDATAEPTNGTTTAVASGEEDII